ncbi:glycine oxidase [Sulfurivirga caldicuralii]|uniref:Glycine oxidase n=1 Tax=Sulfurivirga caldicuralii TaxID=364032 RepID=A0A1N6GK65_9GAMM|nr:glycine oxidase ThiO [Sulfurivirga caldicuralii]SIO07914.1 glycine oxidase [Sulfurivirga caldicuralii]
MSAQSCDVLIIGGGISGLMSAWFLQQAGRQVTLIERHVCGREASWAGGGILSPMYPWRYPDAVNVLAQHSQPQFEPLSAELAELTGIDPEYFPTGMLMLDSEQWETAQAWCERWGYVLEVLDDRALSVFEPRLHTARKLALWMPEIASIRNPRMVKALAKAVQLKGVALMEHTPAEAIDPSAERVRVRTPQGWLEAEDVVVTAGAWSAQLVPELPIEPVRGQIVAIDAPVGFLHHMVMEQDRYLIPRKDGLILVGSTVEQAGFDKRTDEAAREALLSFAYARYPELAMFEVAHHWAGLRPGNPDSIPYIGAHPAHARLWLNTGHFRNGVVTSIASAQLLRALIQVETPPFDPSPYALERSHALSVSAP